VGGRRAGPERVSGLRIADRHAGAVVTFEHGFITWLPWIGSQVTFT
jgi:hypothetical protein